MFNPLLHVVVLIAAIEQACSAAASAPFPEEPAGLGLGLKFDKRSGSLPTLTLPYSTYQATSYDSAADVRDHLIDYIYGNASPGD
jgi:hypothetical protein